MAEFKPVIIDNADSLDTTVGAFNVDKETGDITIITSDGTITNKGTAVGEKGDPGADGGIVVFQDEPRWEKWFDKSGDGDITSDVEFTSASVSPTSTVALQNIRFINGKFYAVYGGIITGTTPTGAGSIWESTDGSVWTQVYSHSSMPLIDICYENGQYFVTAGLGSTSTSTSATAYNGAVLAGSTFSSLKAVSTVYGRASLKALACGDGVVVAGGSYTQGSTNAIYYIANKYTVGETTTQSYVSFSPSVGSFAIDNVAFGNHKFLISASNKYYVMPSNSDQATQITPEFTDGAQSIIFDGTRFIVYTIRAEIWTSEDCETWEKIDTTSPITSNSRLKYADGYYILYFPNRVNFYISTDLAIWAAVNVPKPATYNVANNAHVANGLLVVGYQSGSNASNSVRSILYSGAPEIVAMSHRIVDKKADLDFSTISVGSIVYVAEEQKQYIKGANGAEYEFGGASGGGEVVISQEPNNRLVQKEDGLYADGVGIEELTEVDANLFVKIEDLTPVDIANIIERLEALEEWRASQNA